MRNTITLLVLAAISMTLVAQNSPNITRVLEYRPAPGQHINRLFPTAAMSDTPENALKFAEANLINNKSMLGLGAFGGYVVVGFDHPILNIKGEYDFKGLGNAFPNSSEPGIVMVCQDLNKNGKPDKDEVWYELAGSEYFKEETIKNYEITYYRPEPDGEKTNIRWTDNQGGEGTVTHISFASQATMYPLWVTENTMTFKGTKLKNTVYNDGIFKLPAFDWGYADNNANSDPIEKNGFKIEWAVDADGNSVDLAYIDFIKIYTGQLQEAGRLGETSTEVSGIVDLHPDAVLSSVSTTNSIKINPYISGNQLSVRGVDKISKLSIYSISGNLLLNTQNPSSNFFNISSLPMGVYIVRIEADGKIWNNKIIKR